MALKHQKKRCIRQIIGKLFTLNTIDIILDTNINTINKDKIMVIVTSKTGKYSERPLITNNNNNTNNKTMAIRFTIIH